MCRIKFSFVLLIAATGIASSAPKLQIDTLYYDDEWQSLSAPVFANYYRVIELGDNSRPKHFKDFYITGEPKGEGLYLTLDPDNANNIVRHGKWTSYYKSGKVEETGMFDNGLKNGQFTSYFENGSIQCKYNAQNDLYHGLFTQFTDEGLCMQLEYDNGIPVTDYYTITNDNGYFSKIKIEDGKPIWESPELSDLELSYKDGQPWRYYVHDGIMASMHVSEVDDYGKYYRVYLNIANYSFFSLNFDPSDTMVKLKDKYGNEKTLVVQTAEEYDKKIRNKQRWEEFFVALGTGLAAASAGYSKTVTTGSYYGGASVSGSATIYGSRGFAIGSYSGNKHYYGSYSETSTTYDAGAAYQAQLAASQVMASFSAENLMERQARNEGYMKLTTIKPGESVVGYFNLPKEKGYDINIALKIGDADYIFPYSLVDPEKRKKEEAQYEENKHNKKLSALEKQFIEIDKFPGYALTEDQYNSINSIYEAGCAWFESNKENLTDKQVKRWNKIANQYEDKLKDGFKK